MVIIACILFGYNTINYLDLRHDIAQSIQYAKPQAELIAVPGHAATLRILIDDIALEDAIILCLAAIISYVFAGYTLKPVQRALIIQKNFSENASHELRTPLSVIKSDAEVLLRSVNPSKDEVSSTLKSIVEEIDRMTVMTNDLLMLARSEHHVMSPYMPVNMVEIVKNVARKMNSLAVKGGVKINCITRRNEYVINGDKLALERVFLNILQNAITHTPQDGFILVEIGEDTDHVVVAVQDTGKGINAEDLPYVFERFYKGQNSQGTGLGLPIIKEIIDNHKGEVRIRSKVGVGTEVIVKIPYIDQV
jgi:two-component system sensor histidine kinase VicK